MCKYGKINKYNVILLLYLRYKAILSYLEKVQNSLVETVKILHRMLWTYFSTLLLHLDITFEFFKRYYICFVID